MFSQWSRAAKSFSTKSHLNIAPSALFHAQRFEYNQTAQMIVPSYYYEQNKPVSFCIPVGAGINPKPVPINTSGQFPRYRFPANTAYSWQNIIKYNQTQHIKNKLQQLNQLAQPIEEQELTSVNLDNLIEQPIIAAENLLYATLTSSHQHREKALAKQALNLLQTISYPKPTDTKLEIKRHELIARAYQVVDNYELSTEYFSKAANIARWYYDEPYGVELKTESLVAHGQYIFSCLADKHGNSSAETAYRFIINRPSQNFPEIFLLDYCLGYFAYLTEQVCEQSYQYLLNNYPLIEAQRNKLFQEFLGDKKQEKKLTPGKVENMFLRNEVIHAINLSALLINSGKYQKARDVLDKIAKTKLEKTNELFNHQVAIKEVYKFNREIIDNKLIKEGHLTIFKPTK